MYGGLSIDADPVTVTFLIHSEFTANLYILVKYHHFVRPLYFLCIE